MQTAQIDLKSAVHLTRNNITLVSLYSHNMKILQWLFKASDQQPRETTTISEEKPNTEDIVLYNKQSKAYQRSKRRHKTTTDPFGCKIVIKPLGYLCREDVSKACFYSTITLRRPTNLERNQNWVVKMKKEDIMSRVGLGISTKAEATATATGGNKVLPISENAGSSSNNINEQSESENKDKPKSNKAKTLSRMKELIRWAAAAKSDKGAKFIIRKFRNRGALKALAGNDDEMSIESPKISFRWDAESCTSTTSSAISKACSSRHVNAISLTCTPSHDKDLSFNRKGNWITTDSDFVVLEL